MFFLCKYDHVIIRLGASVGVKSLRIRRRAGEPCFLVPIYTSPCSQISLVSI
jgi:hypothetical protein